MRDIGKIIKTNRKRCSDLTQAQLGAIVFNLPEETAQTKMSKIESGKASVTVEQLRQIEGVLGLAEGTLDKEIKDQLKEERNQKNRGRTDDLIESRRQILKESIPNLDKNFPQLVDYLTSLCTAAKNNDRVLMREILKGAVREIEGAESANDELRN